MNEGPIILNVHIEAVQGREEDLVRELSALVAPTRRETGCLAYELHRNAEDKNKFMFYEKFINQAALDLHIGAPYFRKFLSYREVSDPIATQVVTRWASLS